MREQTLQKSGSPPTLPPLKYSSQPPPQGTIQRWRLANDGFVFRAGHACAHPLRLCSPQEAMQSVAFSVVSISEVEDVAECLEAGCIPLLHDVPAMPAAFRCVSSCGTPKHVEPPPNAGAERPNETHVWRQGGRCASE